MIWLLFIVIGLTIILALFIYLGVRQVKFSLKQVADEIKKIRLSDIGSLAEECRMTLSEKNKENMNIDNFESCAKMLDNAFNNRKEIQKTFYRKGFYNYYVLPTGALIGELIRKNTGYKWIEGEGRAPYLVFEHPDYQKEAHPFEAILSGILYFRKGSIYKYLSDLCEAE